MNYPREDTIVAISTPPGEGGIGIVRMSGEKALLIADRIFNSPKGIKPSQSPSHRIYYGFIVNPLSGEKIDEVLLSVMRAPNTYTREDVVEINCHGGYVVLRRVLELVVESGARLALPGEFTMRAFLNGRIDLTQAEAVLDLIRSKTEAAEKVALEHLGGGLRRQLEDLLEGLKNLLTEIEAFIDFPEEDINLSPLNWTDLLMNIEKRLSRLSESFYHGHILREGIATVIAGRPNVGKSSLLNALLGTDRAIVTDIPGTTRDIIEEIINVKGIPLRLIDTAGIREARDLVEAEGIKRTESAIERADMVLLVIDGSEELTPYDLSLISRLKGQKKRTIVILNKKDKGIVVDKGVLNQFPCIEISALKGEGIDDLKELIFNKFIAPEDKSRAGFESLEGAIITRTRHKALLDDALQFVRDALSSMQGGQPLEIVSFNLRSAIQTLNAIIGIEFSEEDILERIFSEFCIGK